MREMQLFYPFYTIVGLCPNCARQGQSFPNSSTHIAALILQHGVRKIYTADSDFKKFELIVNN